jgi:Sulfotransferase family
VTYSRYSEELHRQAIELTGLSDFGDYQDHYRQGLDALIAAVASDAQLTELGEGMFTNILLGGLIGRLEAENNFSAHPQAREQKIKRPIIVTGFTRSGTTALHRLLSHSPGSQSLQYWLTSSPMPRPPRGQWENHPKFNQTRLELEQLYSAAPDIKKIHNMQAEEPDECRLILAQSFMTYALMGFVWAPSYTDWLKTADMAGAYRRYREVLQLIGLGNPALWVLKCPMHIYSIDLLLAEFPDACIVHTCREPSEAMPSVCSLMHTVSAPFQNMPDKKRFGRNVLEDYGWQMDRFMELRRGLDPARFLDVQYDQFVSDPLGTATGIYDHFGIDIGDSELAALRQWTCKNTQHRFGKHQYSAAEYGLSTDYINDRFAQYRRQYLQS